MILYIPNTLIKGVPVQDTVAGGTTLLTLACLNNDLEGITVDVLADHYSISETVRALTQLTISVGTVTHQFELTYNNIVFPIINERTLYELNLYLEHV